MQRNFNASAVLVGDRGVLVAGPSGSGKSTLCLALLRHCRLHGVAGKLVSDDQVWLTAAGGHLIATSPEPIAGLIEIRGLGPVPIDAEPRMVVDLLVRLVDAAEVPRLPDERTEMLAGCSVPLLDLPAGNAHGAVHAIAGRLRLPPFRD